MGNKFDNSYEVRNAYELSVSVGKKAVTVIYGQLSKGGFIAIPKWRQCVKMEAPTDVLSNALAISSKLFSEPEKAKIIAEAVKEHWESAEKEAPNAEESTAELSEEVEKDRFTAMECNFQGTLGYMVSQFHNGEKAVEQFIPKSVYKSYCKAADIQPEIINGREGENQKPHSAEHIHEREER